MTQLVLFSIAGSCLVSAILVPIVRTTFRRWGIVDRPDKERKLHDQAVSLGGGLAVFVSVLITFGALLAGDQLLGAGLLSDTGVSAAALETSSPNYSELESASRTGRKSGGQKPVADPIRCRWCADAGRTAGRRDRAPRCQKLLLQILVVVAIVGGGTVVQSFNLFGYDISLGIFAYPLTVLWLLAAINALNLLDGADAMASTVGAIISGGLAVLCLQTGNPWEPWSPRHWPDRWSAFCSTIVRRQRFISATQAVW